MSFTQFDPRDEAALEGEDLVSTSPPLTIASITEEEDGSSVVELTDAEDLDILPSVEQEFEQTEHNANLAEFLDEADLETIASSLLEKVTEDNNSRKEWLDILEQGLEFLGIKSIDKEELIHESASSVVHPLLMEAVVKFQARAYTELFPSTGPVKTQIMGVVTPDREDQSRRVKDFMNYQVQHLMPEYGPELDRTLFQVGYAGCSFKKTYFDTSLGRPTSVNVPPQEVIVSYYTTDLETSPRYTHAYTLHKNDFKKRVAAGQYRDIEIEPIQAPEQEELQQSIDETQGVSPSVYADDLYEIKEIFVYCDIPGFEHPDGIALPYVVTIESSSCKVLSIVRNWHEGDPNYRPRSYLVKYEMIPGLGFYGYGYLHLIGGLASTATGTLRSLLDSAAFANFQAGFKLRGMRITGSNDPLRPGEFRDVNSALPDITKAIMPLPFKEPSATLANLLTFITGAGEKFADSTESLVSEASTYGPVGTIMALLEQGGRLFTASHKRLHQAQARDFKILHDLNYEWLPDEYPYDVVGGVRSVFKEDFDGRIDVIPVSDPNLPTQAHRIAKANALFEIAKQAPDLHELPAVILHVYHSMGIEQPERFLKPPPPAAQPLDPITENMNALMGTPLKAGPEQNHQAHIAAHRAFMTLPEVQGNQAALTALSAHISEHIALDYRNQMMSALGQLPPQGAQLPPQIEDQLAVAAAEATQQLVNGEKNRLAEEAMQAPEHQIALLALQIERERVQGDQAIRAGDLAVKEAKMYIDDENKDNELELKDQLEARNRLLKLLVEKLWIQHDESKLIVKEGIDKADNREQRRHEAFIASLSNPNRKSNGK